MRLKLVGFHSTSVSDLMPLHGMPIGEFNFHDTKVSDLLPLDGMKLNVIVFTPKNIVKGMDVIRRMESVKSIKLLLGRKGTRPPAEFWKKYDAGELNK